MLEHGAPYQLDALATLAAPRGADPSWHLPESAGRVGHMRRSPQFPSARPPAPVYFFSEHQRVVHHAAGSSCHCRSTVTSRFPVWPVVVSAMRISSIASQHNMTWARDPVLRAVTDGSKINNLVRIPPTPFPRAVAAAVGIGPRTAADRHRIGRSATSTGRVRAG